VISGNEETFSRQVLMTLYRVAQEAFTNIQKHAQASCVQVGLHFAGEEASLRICDDGCGFDAAAWLQHPERLEEGYGLRGMRERLELVGGSFHLQSQPGRGTQLSVTVPGTGMALPVYRDGLPHAAVS
jgi:signal transduction histidine kinase